MAPKKPLTSSPVYYQLQPTPVLEGVYDVRKPDLEVRWLSGQSISTPLPNPIEIELDDRFGTRMADIFIRGILVMSDRLVAAIQRAGVTNLQTFPAVLNDAQRGLRLPGFQAVQIVGTIKAADMKKSIAHDPDNIGRDIVGFQKLVIDPKAARGALMFRMLESASTIIVHEKVKQELDKEQWQFVSVHPTDEKPFPLDLENWAADFQEVLQAGRAARSKKKPVKKKGAARKSKATSKSKRAASKPKAPSRPKGRSRKQASPATRRPRGKR
ncbi:imm11 family protein [Pyxidicoccus sp. MSG2]|uniref:imm11 family protein n=1 Tax=Pyxidicoccus sp. MSG2 TaxID=2996790 RepID=UPI00226D7D2E|nr:DUF1629 domain-containing protein [Pyxidicoccus sp. MSG2]MCY1017414.1 hypothetical protein [Pyxidicoccus sp. MSG2]